MAKPEICSTDLIDCLTNFFDELYNRHLSKKFLFVIDQKIQSLFGISIHEIGIKISNSNIYFMKNMTSKLALIIVLQLLFCKSSVQHLCMYLYLNISCKRSGTDTLFYYILIKSVCKSHCGKYIFPTILNTQYMYDKSDHCLPGQNEKWVKF